MAKDRGHYVTFTWALLSPHVFLPHLAIGFYSIFCAFPSTSFLLPALSVALLRFALALGSLKFGLERYPFSQC